MGMLDGKEAEGKIGEVGSYYVDVTKEGQIEISLSVATTQLEGCVVVESKNSAKVDLLKILEIQAKKSGKPWTETVVTQLKLILGLAG